MAVVAETRWAGTPRRPHWNLLVSYLNPQWPNAVLLTALILGNIGLQLVSPQIVRRFIDAAAAGGSLESLYTAALLFLGAAIASQALAIAATYLGENVAWRATNALRLDLVLHCLRLDMSFHNVHTPGKLIERVDGDVMALGNFFSQMMVRLLGNGILALGFLLLLFKEDWRFGLVGAAHALLTMILLGEVQKPAVTAWGDFRQASAELLGFMGERLQGTEDIRANGAEPYVMHQLYRLMRPLLRKGRRAALMGELTFTIGFSVQVLSTMATLAIGATLFSRGLMTIGTLYLLVDYIRRLEGPLDQIRHQATDLQRAAASIERVEELFRAAPTLVENPRAELPSGALAVAFEGVAFRYDDKDGMAGGEADSVLEEISFELRPARVLGLLGRTGSGKTTLTRLLFRLYDPTAGAISLDGEDIRDVGLSDLRRHVGMVTQDVQLFEASIRDNLTFFNTRVPDGQVLAALEELGLGDWHRSLPDGLDTRLESGGWGLSAGEAQLLAFARVFLRDPGLVILDEASSRLDPATEQLLERAVERLLQDRTAIIIAHRLGTVQRADEIMILEQGRICEHGPRHTLAEDPTSRFYGLLQAGLEEALV
jgi:ATP-binding cassette subfamily B protein